MNYKKIRTILIANRSEVAVRIIATCAARNIKTVALFTKEDQESSHVFFADRAFQLAKPSPQGYLDQNEILAIAHKAGVDAIHPGYGFLSENHRFAQRVIDEGFLWVGPDPKIIKLMGDKLRARHAMIDLSIPVIPGTSCNAKNISAENALHKAETIGFPLILKSAAGGGGKAMRKVEKADDFIDAWNRVVSESEKFFSSSDIIIEKYITQGRHIEVQIAGDGKDAIHLFERECSIQRRHQKIIEETPCSFISDNLRKKLFDASVKIAQEMHYNNIGTVEFIVTPDETFYFLEMNTRLQVEHSVTEMTTGIDLVDLQITLTQTKKLPFSQNSVSQNGHAIECRIYAENPLNNFSPETGTLLLVSFPPFPSARYDHTLEIGTKITPFFDPMIAKITTFGLSRTAALGMMKTVLDNTFLAGVTTNQNFLTKILTHKNFIQGSFHTQWLTKRLCETLCTSQSNTDEINLTEQQITYLAAGLIQQEKNDEIKPSIDTKPQSSLWRNKQWRS